MKKICIYHGNCADGFTAAWIVRKAEGDMEFVAGAYKDAPPDVRGKTVYIVDFSYKRPIMELLVKDAEKVIHIDHHTSAIRDMKGFEALNLVKFYSPENTESGAMLAWRYFYPTIAVPNFIKHIDDNDRRQFKLPGTREIQANAYSYKYTFENWDKLFKQKVKDQLREGTAIERRMMKDTKELMGVVVRRMVIDGHNVPVANVPYQYGSDVCAALWENEPFSAYYYDTLKGREFRLWSADDGLDVAVIAEKFGGGGHAHASGFRISYAEAEEFEIVEPFELKFGE